MPVYYDTARRRWRYEFDRYVEGRRQRTTKLLPKPWTRREADAYAAEQDARLYAIATGAIKPKRLISEAIHLYLIEHAPGLKSAPIIERELVACADAYMGCTIDQLPDVAREYATRQSGLLQPATIRNRLAYIRAACRWAWKHHGIADHDPAERMVMPKVRNERHAYIDRAAMLRIARAMTNRAARAVALVAFYSGMRLGEVLRAAPTDRGWLIEDTKNGDRRLVPIHPRVAHLSTNWPPACSARTAHKRFTAAAQAMGFDDLRFHDLRHSAASEMINAGVDLYTVGAVLGHRAAASTKRYSHLTTDTLAKALWSIGKR